MSGLRLEGLAKRYEDVEALRPLDLEVAPGELLVVLGPSGCGKTTLLRLVAGLEEASAGRILIGGRDVTRERPGRRNVAMVFQTYALFPHMTVAENVGFGLVVRDVERVDADARVRRAAEAVGCAHLLGRRPWQLSGGERQRVALARALVREPDVFLLDEPLSNLDAELRAQMRVELKELHQRVGGTTLHVTHDQVEALVLGDRVAVLRAGELEQVGTPGEIWARPANRFVARFVGSPPMNLVPWDSPLVRGLVPAGLEAEAGVRPEDVRLGGEGTPGRVRLVEPVGGEAYVHVELDGGDVVARVSAAGAPSPGDEVRLSADSARVHAFDLATGRRAEWT